MMPQGRDHIGSGGVKVGGAAQTRWVFVGKFTDDWPEEHRDLVGQIIIAFSQLERVLYLTPKRLRGGQLVVYEDWPGRFQNAVRCNQIEKECELVMAGDALHQVKAIVEDVRDVNDRRNWWVHGYWIDRGDGLKVVINAEEQKVPDVAELRALLADTRSARDRLNSVQWPALTPAERAKLPEAPEPKTYQRPGKRKGP
jgi:hypothetical protein